MKLNHVQTSKSTKELEKQAIEMGNIQHVCNLVNEDAVAVTMEVAAEKIRQLAPMRDEAKDELKKLEAKMEKLKQEIKAVKKVHEGYVDQIRYYSELGQRANIIYENMIARVVENRDR